jgi:hypothetical protein
MLRNHAASATLCHRHVHFKHCHAVSDDFGAAVSYGSLQPCLVGNNKGAVCCGPIKDELIEPAAAA